MLKEINENILELYCFEHFKSGSKFADLNNNKIKIIKPGYLNKFEGPDFLNFRVLNSYGKVEETDIEIETELSNFYKHKHHLDKNYDNVKYIFVYEKGHFNKKDNHTIIELKEEIDKFSMEDLKELKKAALKNKYKISILNDLKNAGLYNKRNSLIRYGLIRFNKKVNDLKALIFRYGEETAIIIKVIESAGLTRNKKQFRNMAENINWNKLKARLESASLNYKKELLFDFFQTIIISSYKSKVINPENYLLNPQKLKFNFYKVYPKAAPNQRIKFFVPIILKIMNENDLTFLKKYFDLDNYLDIYKWFKESFLFNKYKIKIQNQRIKSFIYNSFFPFYKIKYPNLFTDKYLFNFPSITHYSVLKFPINLLTLKLSGLKEIHQQGLLYLCR